MLRNALLDKGLSRRESEVAAFVAKGASNKEVAEALFVTEKTIKFHLTSVYKKIGIKSRSQLIVWSAKHLSFEERTPVAEPVLVASPISASANGMPAGINKVGNA